PSGFVIVAGDDAIEPVIAFSSSGSYNPTSSNPLGALVTNDLSRRSTESLASTSNAKGPGRDYALKSATKWKTLLGQAWTSDVTLAGIATVSDPRVDPLVASKWGQSTESGNPTYNYYTPPGPDASASNYPSGCVATAMAQLMRYHQYPINGVGTPSFTVNVDGIAETRSLLGGDGVGGPYSWVDMPLDPGSSTSETQRQAIGALCYDAGVAVSTRYTATFSGAYLLDAWLALKNTFGYSAVESESLSPSAFDAAVNSNLNAGYPVLFAISNWFTGSGHAVVCDGYGYNAGTIYHHLNMGWTGSQDVWYNLPDINSSPAYDGVDGVIYNINKTSTGEIISGRVLDDIGLPVAGVPVTAQATGGGIYQVLTNARGIYALDKLPSATVFTVSIDLIGYEPLVRTVSTGISATQGSTTGNNWGIDFTLVPKRITKLLEDAADVGIRHGAVSAAFSGFFYIEADDRSCGIRVESPGHALQPGMRADVIGKMRTDGDGERYIEALSAVRNGSGTVKPLMLTNRALGGAAFTGGTTIGQAGVKDGEGLNNIGLLISTTGQLTYVDPAGAFVYVNDGSNLNDGNALGSGCTAVLGVRALVTGDLPLDAYAAVTGISTIETVAGNAVRAIKMLPTGGVEEDYALPGGGSIRMCYVPAGSFAMGNNGSEGYSKSTELPQHQVTLSAYWIGKYEITRGQFRKFIDAGGYGISQYWSTAGWTWKGGRLRPDYWEPPLADWWNAGTGYAFTQTEDHPVVGIYYHEAEAFCNWAGLRLPTEAQWEKAARWDANASTQPTDLRPRVYPWGNTWDYDKCNNVYDHNPAGGGYVRYQTAPVGSYPYDPSPYGCRDMVGNASEWCKDRYGAGYYSTYPANSWPSDPQGPISGTTWVLRGANWSSLNQAQYNTYVAGLARSAYRGYADCAGTTYSSRYGFRVAR
ncbi:MAG: SUMF1/EgtB/PvdO family nonheme iron enzyme, partial [Armatimonadota bacterium]